MLASLKKSKLECKVYNYSGYVSLFLVKNDGTRFDYSASDKCLPQYPDTTVATVPPSSNLTSARVYHVRVTRIFVRVHTTGDHARTPNLRAALRPVLSWALDVHV